MKQEAFFNRYHYNIDRDYLGGGGFGKVYKAFDDTLDRTVAIKVAEVRREQENVSLLKEVQLAERIPKHRNIAHYQSCHRFKGPQGTFDYGILQYYPQGNLSQLLEKEHLSPEQKEGIARGILEGLKHLHNHRIVHRDLKSSNILMAWRPGGEYVPKIADFGLSKQFDEYDRSYFSNSFAGGSLLYVAPEQLAGDKMRKNADLWSLGVVLYELFVEEVPFYPRQSDIGTETGRAEIVRQINEASIPKEIEHVPEFWRKVIESCLVADPKKRVGSVEEIREVLGEKPVKQEASDETKVEKKTSEETVIEQEQRATSEQTVQTTERRSQISYRYILTGQVNWFSRFFTSSIGQKVIMSLTGLFLIVFLVVHLSGNLQLLIDDGGEAFNTYTYIMTHNPVIVTISYLLYTFILIHAIQGIVLKLNNRSARSKRYAYNTNENKSFASRNMAQLGLLILVFLGIHMGDFWFSLHFGEVDTVNYASHPEPVKDLYAEVEASFSIPWIVIVYVISMVGLAFHLWHGFESAFRTLGIKNNKYTPIIDTIGKIYSIVIPLGFAIIPLYYFFFKF